MSVYENLVNHTGFWDVKTHCDVNDISYAITSWQSYDECAYHIDLFKSKNDAIDYLMDYIGCNRTPDEYEIGDDGQLRYKLDPIHYAPLLKEEDGQLYYYNYAYYIEDRQLLFDPRKFVDPPTTKEELRQFLMDGHMLEINWNDAPCEYQIGNMLIARVVMDDQKEVSVSYLPVWSHHKCSLEYLSNLKHGVNWGRYYDKSEDEYVIFKQVLLKPTTNP